MGLTDSMNALIKTYLQGTPAQCGRTLCDATTLGSLLTQLTKIGYYPLPSQSFGGNSFTSFVAQLRNMQVENLCSPGYGSELQCSIKRRIEQLIEAEEASVRGLSLSNYQKRSEWS